MTYLGVFGPDNMVVPVPGDRERMMRGWAAITSAYEHAAWEQAWHAATGRPWSEWVADRAARRRPPKAHFDIYIDGDHPYNSRVTVTAGVVRTKRVETDAKVGGVGTVTITVPMSATTITNR